MTSPDADARPVVATLSGPHRGGVRQATFVEMHRAQAEVVAAVMAARELPRDIPGAVADMKAGCARWSVANRAFYRYKRAGKAITGESIHLARFLAGCWGNMQYGITELSRDDDESQMQAWAWDLQKNNRPTTTFIVPHGRMANDEYKALTDPRDVYENNANMGGRRVREMILAVLPPWFRDEAVDLCRKTLADGEPGQKLPEFPVRVANMLDGFAKMGVTRRQVEEKQGRDADEFTPEDLASLTIVYQSLRRAETTRDEEFPAARVTAEDITTRPMVHKIDDQGRRVEPDGPPPEPVMVGEPAPPQAARAAAPRRSGGKPSTEPQRGTVLGLMSEGGFSAMTSALYAAQHLAGLDEPRGSLTLFSVAELSKVINTLKAWKTEDPEGGAGLHRHLDDLLPAEDDPAWGPVEQARRDYLRANGRHREAADDDEQPTAEPETDGGEHG